MSPPTCFFVLFNVYALNRAFNIFSIITSAILANQNLLINRNRNESFVHWIWHRKLEVFYKHIHRDTRIQQKWKEKNSKPHNINKNRADKREKNNPILCATIVCNFMPNNTSLITQDCTTPSSSVFHNAERVQSAKYFCTVTQIEHLHKSMVPMVPLV